MIDIIATDSTGGMIIGKTYRVGAELASTLINLNRAKYADDSLNPVEEKKEEVSKPSTGRKRRSSKK